MKYNLIIKLSVLVFLISAPYLLTKNIYKPNPTKFIGSSGKSSALQKAEGKVTPSIDIYLKQSDKKDQDNLVSYLSYYRSWYQAVVPAPKELYSELSSRAKNLAEYIKLVAEQFKSSNKNMPGSSSLSNDGEQFYQDIIAELKNKQLKLTTFRPN